MFISGAALKRRVRARIGLGKAGLDFCVVARWYSAGCVPNPVFVDGQYLDLFDEIDVLDLRMATLWCYALLLHAGWWSKVFDATIRGFTVLDRCCRFHVSLPFRVQSGLRL